MDNSYLPVTIIIGKCKVPLEGQGMFLIPPSPRFSAPIWKLRVISGYVVICVLAVKPVLSGHSWECYTLFFFHTLECLILGLRLNILPNCNLTWDAGKQITFMFSFQSKSLFCSNVLCIKSPVACLHSLHLS